MLQATTPLTLPHRAMLIFNAEGRVDSGKLEGILQEVRTCPQVVDGWTREVLAHVVGLVDRRDIATGQWARILELRHEIGF